MSGPLSVFVDALKLWWSWRGKAERPFLRSIVLVVMAALFCVATVGSAILSSLVVSGSNLTVLIKSSYCGFHVNETTKLLNYQQNVFSTANEYANKCYGPAGKRSTCNEFGRAKMNPVATNAPCAFGTAMCIPEHSIAFDTGVFSVNDAFGLNLRDSNLVSMRKRTTCQILPLEGRTTVRNVTELFQRFGTVPLLNAPLPGEEAVFVNYGATSQTQAYGTNLSTTWIKSLVASNVSSEHEVM